MPFRLHDMVRARTWNLVLTARGFDLSGDGKGVVDAVQSDLGLKRSWM